MTYLGEIYDVDVQELDPDGPLSPDPERWGYSPILLKPHQRRALHRCREMEEVDMRSATDAPGVFMRTSIGIYGDMVGSGKSQVMLALIAGDKGVPRTIGGSTTCMQTFAGGRIQVAEPDYMRPIKTTLIVVPHTLASQWESYVQPLVHGGMKVLVVNRMKGIDRLDACSDVAEYDLVIVTSSFYDNIVHLFSSKGVKLRRVIVDEADTIAISSTTQIRSSFAWFVTAAYGNLIFPTGNMRYEVLLRQNVSTARGISHQGFIRNLFMGLHNTLSRGNLKRIIVKNSDEFVERSMNNAVVSHLMVPSLTPHSIRVLTGVVDRIVLECLEAGDVAAAIAQIAPENRHTAQEVVTLMAASYTDRVESLERDIQASSARGGEEEAEAVGHLSVLVADLRNKISCMRSRLLEDDVCCICLEDTHVNAVVPCCATKMCLECVARWVLQRASCVLCRRPLTFSDLHVIEAVCGPSSDTDAEEGMAIDMDTRTGKHLGGRGREGGDMDACGVHHTKMQNLEVILRLHAGAKSLIYSNHDKTFEEVCACLSTLGKTYDHIRGGHRQISNIVEAYKDDRIDVLLINATHYGSGLNLENTTDIIMFQALNTEIEKQVVGRAQRMGRSCGLRVWHLLYENELQFVSAQAQAVTSGRQT